MATSLRTRGDTPFPPHLEQKRILARDSALSKGPMSEQSDLSIIIVNWNSAVFMRKCLASISENRGTLNIEVIVVDNASYDGCQEIIAAEFPGVCFIQSPENLGFARANNLGFEHSSGRNLLFLNPDTEVVGTALQVLLASLESIPDAGLVGARLLNSDLSVQTCCIQAFPTILNQAFDFERLRLAFPKCRWWDISPLLEDSEGAVPVEVISGACLMIKRKVFEEAGLFSTDYFMYSEEVDLCWRVKELGWKQYYVGNATVIHHGGQSTLYTPDRRFSFVMMRESRLRFLTTRRGWLYGNTYRVSTALAATCRLVLLGAALLLTLGRFRRQELLRAFSKWMAVLGWAAGAGGRPGSGPLATRVNKT